MQQIHLNVSQILEGFYHVMDTIWIITPDNDEVEFLRDSMTPEQEGQTLAYSHLCERYIENFIYPADLGAWDEVLSLRALKDRCSGGDTKCNFDMRFRNDQFGFEWHEAHISVLHGDGQIPDRVLLTSRFANNDRRAAIVEQAVRTEYDYVVYIEADKNSYVMYASNDTTGTPLPPVASDDYEKEVAQFHKLYVPEEERNSLTEKLSVAHVAPRLKETGEYVVYCTCIEDGDRRDKKLRFSYFNEDPNIWVLTRTDITEILNERRLKERLQTELNEAMVASRAKSDFLSKMSHDIRTPMNAIIGMTAIAKSHIENIARVEDCLDKTSQASKLLLNIINEVLDMSKIESGHLVLAEEEINLGDLVNGIVAMVQPQIKMKHLEFQAHINNVFHEIVVSDMQRLQQLLMNLLSNAVKYTPVGGRIVLELFEKEQLHTGVACYEFIVEDNGIGLKPEFISHLFDPFERADDERIADIQGTGLGLSICKAIAEKMGGDIHAESRYGEGSRFTATVNLRTLDMPVMDETLKGRSVLVVDDDETVCRNACQRLNELEMKAEWVTRGEEAVRKVAVAHEKNEDYFSVIVDLQMPGLDGVETSRQIRQIAGEKLPIIMISAYDTSEYINETEQIGINDFITKPLFRSRLSYKLKQFLEPQADYCIQANPLQSHCYLGKRLLLAEDNALNREIVIELLSETGIEVETAENGQEALLKFEASPKGYYDLIFMDMQMPVMDGCTATEKIRSLERTDAEMIPIIAMTANAFIDDRKKTKAAGMNEHLVKPLQIEQMYGVLDRWLL